MIDYLTVVEVLAIHADQIERYGCSQGVRDHGLLEAALYRAARPREARTAQKMTA